ncbi:MAG: hypothetical protein HZB42_14475 [Sphingobacteriales bacterium]|nr:hypothetical protein [Sphingobacteriales bacterium]
MKKYNIFFGVLFLQLQQPCINAQDCTPEILAQKQGHWTKSTDFFFRLFPAGFKGKSMKTVDSLYKLVLNIYPDPKGCEARWYGSYGSSREIVMAEPYQLITYYLMYYCKGNKKDFFLGSETDDWIYIWANHFGTLSGSHTVNGKDYWTIKRPTEVKEGSLYYEYPQSSSSPEPLGLWVRAWMIIYPGKLPYIPVTRKEYLLEARQEVTKTEAKVIADVKKYTIIRPAAEQEAAKQKELDYLKRSYPDNPRRWQRYLEDYQTDEQRLQTAVDKMTAQYEATLKLMNDLLDKLSEEELQKPAVVSEIATAFKGFEDDFKERNANMLIRWNPDYFDKKLSKATPQFFTLIIREDRSSMPMLDISRRFREKFRFDILSSMLGK